MKFLSYINNELFIKDSEKFTLIIGKNPSQGARSPILWNKTYKKLNKNIKMYPADCDLKNLSKLFKLLEANKNFIGGAITNPYKEILFKYLGKNINQESKKIGAINCLYRENNKLFGINTDGLGAIYSLKKNFKTLKNKSFLILGTGGTALTIASYLQKYINKKKDLLVVGRNKIKLNYFKKIFRCNISRYPEVYKIISKYDFVINCTSLGAKPNIDTSPLKEEIFLQIKPKARIFDVIYNPKTTTFLKYSKKYNFEFLNGLEMNLEQAVKAFIKTNGISEANSSKIRSLMIK